MCLIFSGFFQQLYVALLMQTQDWQRLFHDEVVTKLRLIKETHSATATGGLVFIGFLYGVLHAIGPGHGKVVVSSYLLASKASLKRGIAITFSSAILQACVAIVLVFGLTSLFGLTRDAAEQTTAILTQASFGLIFLIGIVLFWRGGRMFWQLRRSSIQKTCSSDGGHHTPTPKDIEAVGSWKEMLVLIVSIGLRPCSGALLLLLFADLVGVYGIGIIAAFAMAVGTALTTSFLAVLTVYSKAFALHFTRSSGDTLRLTFASFGLIGGLFIILLGTVLLQGNMMPSGLSGVTGAAISTKSHPLMKSFSQTR